jgi:PhnB protein
MSTQTKAIPTGFHSVTPYLTVNDGARAIEFYKRAFGAQEVMRMEAPGGKIGHGEIQIDDSRIMLADPQPAFSRLDPLESGSAATIGCPTSDPVALSILR